MYTYRFMYLEVKIDAITKFWLRSESYSELKFQILDNSELNYKGFEENPRMPPEFKMAAKIKYYHRNNFQ